MMKTIGIAMGVIVAVMGGFWVISGQQPRFEQVQRDLFASGGSFVNGWADYDGDGDLDLFVGFDGMPNRLYRNDKGTFVDAASAAGIADARPTRAAAWGDADGDGDSDLLVGFTPGAGSVLRYYRNNKGAFVDETETAGLTTATGAVRQPAWVDYDGDYDFDLFVAFRDKPNAMFRNDGARFVDVAAELGLADARRTVGAVWFDYDQDNDLDVIVGNMDGDANGLFSQQNGKFIDVAEASGVSWGGRTPNDKANGTVRPCVADVNNDGRHDLFFANYGKNGLFLNRGSGKFEDVSQAWGIAIDARYDTCVFGDMDNDGDLDLYVNGTVTGGQSYRDYLFRNTGKSFEDVTPQEVGSPHGDHGAQWADYDLDGDLDLALTGVQKEGMHWLLRNLLPQPNTANALHVRVVDNRGRRVTGGATISLLKAGTREVLASRLIDGGSGYNSQNDAPVHFGLRDASALVVRVSVPSGPASQEVLQQVDPRKLRGQVVEIKLNR